MENESLLLFIFVGVFISFLFFLNWNNFIFFCPAKVNLCFCGVSAPPVGLMERQRFLPSSCGSVGAAVRPASYPAGLGKPEV